MPLETLLFIFAGVLIALGIWFLLRDKLSIGPDYDECRQDLEKARKDMKQAEADGATEFEGKTFKASVEQFNRLAKRLRVPEY